MIKEYDFTWVEEDIVLDETIEDICYALDVNRDDLAEIQIDALVKILTGYGDARVLDDKLTQVEEYMEKVL